MPRGSRCAPGGFVYHALNRAVARLPLFQKQGDYEAFERVLEEAHERYPIRILAYCLMTNHWHFVLWPEHDQELTGFLRWLTHTHTMRWHAHHNTSGSGHLYQGRFKAFPVENDEYLYTLLRYVERNPLRAGLVSSAESWHWSSLQRWEHGNAKSRQLLANWPLPRPRNWSEHVNTPQTEAEIDVIRRSVQRGTPLGEATWQAEMAERLGLESTLRPRGRPRA
jgi:putative transposase